MFAADFSDSVTANLGVEAGAEVASVAEVETRAEPATVEGQAPTERGPTQQGDQSEVVTKLLF